MLSPAATDDEATRGGAWPLLLLPAVLAYRMPIVAQAGLDLRYLLIPVAALLGARFGLTGVIAVALGGLAFVVGLSSPEWGSIGGSPSLYLVALAVAAIASVSQRERIAWPRWPQGERSAAAMTMAAPALLVLSLQAGFEQKAADDGVRLVFSFGTQALAYFLIFMLGVRGGKLRHLLIGLAIAAVLSWGLTWLGLFHGPRSNLHFELLRLQPVAVLAALVFFSAGATLGRGADRPVGWGWRWPYLCAAVLLFISFGPVRPLASIALDWNATRLYLMGSAALLPVAALMLGALRGSRGVWAGVAIATLLAVAGAFGGFIAIEAPFLAYAYGRLGAYIARPETAEAAQATRRARKAVTAWVLALAAMSAIMGEGGAVRLTLALVFAALFCAAYFFGRRVVRAALASERDVTANGWLSFLIIACTIVLASFSALEWAEELRDTAAGIAFFFASLYRSLRGVVDPSGPWPAHPAGGPLLFTVAAVGVGVFAVVMACRKAWKELRKAWRDMRVMYAYTKLVLFSAKAPARDAGLDEAQTAKPS